VCAAVSYQRRCGKVWHTHTEGLGRGCRGSVISSHGAARCTRWSKKLVESPVATIISVRCMLPSKPFAQEGVGTHPNNNRSIVGVFSPLYKPTSSSLINNQVLKGWGHMLITILQDRPHLLYTNSIAQLVSVLFVCWSICWLHDCCCDLCICFGVVRVHRGGGVVFAWHCRSSPNRHSPTHRPVLCPFLWDSPWVCDVIV